MKGQKTAAFEICDQLGRAPDFHFLPVGNAGNITAYWKGYREYRAARKIDLLPRMFVASGQSGSGADGVGPSGGRTAHGGQRQRPGIGNPASWAQAAEALKESNGFINSVTDEEILAAYKLIARTDGIFVEPASAACLAGLIQCVKAGKIPLNAQRAAPPP